MKKVLLILVAALAASPVLHAQEDGGVRFGLKAAPNMAWLRSDTKGLESDGSKVGFTFGLVTEFPIGAAGNYRFATGLFLNNVGGKYTTPFTYTDANGATVTKDLASDVKLRYVELPLTMKLMTKEIGYMRYYGQIGFGAAFNVRAKADFETVTVDANGVFTGSSTFEDEDVKDSVQPVKGSLIMGAGLEYTFSGSTTLQVGVNYNNGLTNILKDEEVEGKTAKLLQDYLELNIAVFF
ncbi:MAG: PorT family protein [Flavobacteriales bacterium]|nr:PorT family protein [Flavobacteriales bacterium]